MSDSHETVIVTQNARNIELNGMMVLFFFFFVTKQYLFVRLISDWNIESGSINVVTMNTSASMCC